MNTPGRGTQDWRSGMHGDGSHPANGERRRIVLEYDAPGGGAIGWHVIATPAGQWGDTCQWPLGDGRWYAVRDALHLSHLGDSPGVRGEIRREGIEILDCACRI